MSRLAFFVPKEYDNVMVKGFLRRYCGISARLLIRLKNSPDGILVNGRHARTVDLLREGDRIDLNLPQDRSAVKEAELPVTAAWEDEHLVIFQKPANMPVHPSPGHATDTLANAAGAYARKKGETWAFRPINRLDRDTSGLVAVAKNAFCAAKLSDSGIQKEYFAVCQGMLSGSGTIDAPIRIKEGHSIQREVGEGGVRAVTHWRAVAAGKGHTLLRIRLETGRTHQIRVHFASIGMPLAGDDMYGGSRALMPRQALHCAVMEWIHPVNGETIMVTQPLPDDFKQLCEKLEIFV